MQIADNTLHSLVEYARIKLNPHFDERSAAQLIQILFRHYFALDRAALIIEKDRRVTESEILKIHFAVKKLLTGEPVQYIVGEAWFCGHRINVNRSVLIPRPETEELVQWIVDHNTKKEPLILDIGTGSGCIAIALKKAIPGATVIACDISPGALELASINALENRAEVSFLKADILNEVPELHDVDIVVSNPPYIPKSDSGQMSEHVIKFEPHLALFVDDVSPFVFYQRITKLSMNLLSNDGMLAMEIHEKHGLEILSILKNEEFSNCEIVKDMQGKDRIVSGRKR